MNVDMSLLEDIMPLGNETELCINPALGKLYVKRKIDSASVPVYRTLMGISHKNLASILCISAEEGIAVCEYIQGDTLSAMLEAGRLFQEKEIINIVSGICAALSELHRVGIVHRDVNPNNIIITRSGDAVLIDPGIARSIKESAVRDTVIMGTPGYAAPEQFGFTQSDERTDIYAVGVLINMLCTGSLPNEKTAHGRFGVIVKKCTSIDANKRYRDIQSVSHALGVPNEKNVRIFPGLHSRNFFVRLLSWTGYIIAAFLSVMSFMTVRKTPYYICLGILSWLLTCPIPFICFINPAGVWEKLPGIGKCSASIKKPVFYIVGFAAFCVGMVLFFMTPTATS